MNKQTAVEWLVEQLKKVDYNPLEQNGYSKAEERLFDQAKEMEKRQKNNLPIVIHEGIENTWVYIEDGIVHVKPNPKANEQQ